MFFQVPSNYLYLLPFFKINRRGKILKIVFKLLNKIALSSKWHNLDRQVRPINFLNLIETIVQNNKTILVCKFDSTHPWNILKLSKILFKELAFGGSLFVIFLLMIGEKF